MAIIEVSFDKPCPKPLYAIGQVVKAGSKYRKIVSWEGVGVVNEISPHAPAVWNIVYRLDAPEDGGINHGGSTN